MIALKQSFSEKKHGDMREINNQHRFVARMGLNFQNLITARQVHGDRVLLVEHKDKGKKVPDVDGLVTIDPSIVLGVCSADCVPLLFVDPHHHSIGAAHAGWRGTAARIGRNVVQTMQLQGSKPQDILVFIGPHIGMCCYDVSEPRARLFQKEFKNDQCVACHIDGKWHVDIGRANFLTFLDVGVLPEHISAPIFCTSCQSDTFFSYRKDTKKTFGEMMGVIGYAN